jgi:hypothetical protein
MRKGILLLIISGSILISCNNPLNRKYKAETFTEDISALLDAKKISNEDVISITSYVSFHEKELNGISYDDLLKKVKLEATQNLINYGKESSEELKAAAERAKADSAQAVQDAFKAAKEAAAQDSILNLKKH